jgi:hypothetical protein
VCGNRSWGKIIMVISAINVGVYWLARMKNFAGSALPLDHRCITTNRKVNIAAQLYML